MAYQHTAYRQKYTFISIVLFCLLSLSGCSQSPLLLLKQGAGEATLIDTVKLDRHRRFIIPTLSHIGLVIMPVNIPDQSASLNTHLFTSVREESGIMFNRAFSTVTLLSPSARPDTAVDFIIRASLLAASPYLKPMAKDKDASLKQVNNSEQPSKLVESNSVEELNKLEESNRFQRRLRPYHALLKLELLDARNGLGVKAAPMDIAIVKARSGLLGSAQFKSLLRQGLAAYSKDITTTVRTVY
ncbi:MAG: hypothetical protein ACRBBR_02040 [Cellvibrionaceae bacterium]